jgi:hypothetical protein
VDVRVLMLENDNFTDNSTHEPKKIWRRIKMNKELFMKIVIGVWGYDDYFHYKKTPPDCLGSPQFRCSSTISK